MAESSSSSQKTPRKRYLHEYGPYSSSTNDPFSLWMEKWKIRFVSILVLLLVTVLYTVLLPIILVVAIIIDLVRYPKIKGMNITRSFLFFFAYMFVEFAGILIFAGLYLWKLVARPSHEKWMAANYKAQTIWGKYMIFEMISRVVGLKVKFDGKLEDIPPGPKILFMRHVSFADTLIPQGTLSDRFELRYILKKELLYDPAFNICGSRTPQFFLFREAGGEGAMDVEIQGMRNLVSSMTPKTQAVVAIWPEGTRFTPNKRKKILESLAKKDPKAHEIAQNLTNTLLPRVGGALNLLEANKCADVLFCAHTGLEGAADFYEMVSGELCNRTLHMRFKVVKFKDIPQTKEARTQWMYDNWKEVDEWIAKDLEAGKKNK